VLVTGVQTCALPILTEDLKSFSGRQVEVLELPSRC